MGEERERNKMLASFKYGDACVKNRNYKKARTYLLISYNLALKLNYNDVLFNSARALKEVYYNLASLHLDKAFENKFSNHPIKEDINYNLAVKYINEGKMFEAPFKENRLEELLEIFNHNCEERRLVLAEIEEEQRKRWEEEERIIQERINSISYDLRDDGTMFLSTPEGDYELETEEDLYGKDIPSTLLRELYDKMEKTRKAYENRQKIIRIWNNAIDYYNCGEYKNSYEYYLDAYVLAKKQGCTEWKGELCEGVRDSCYNLAIENYNKGVDNYNDSNYDSAREYYNEAERWANRAKDFSDFGDREILNLTIDISQALHDNQEAWEDE